MNRDKAIEIAASALSSNDTTPWDRWAASVVAGADSLLAAMGEPEAIAEHSECCEAQARINEAATEARVVEEIAVQLDAAGMCGRAAWLRSGGWRAKEPVR